MKKLLLLLIPLLFIQCMQNNTKVIKKNYVGGITKNTTEKQLFELFEDDSIVKVPADKKYVNEYVVYEKGGEHLVTVYPMIPKDSAKMVERVQIFSPKYKTEKGISTKSVFKDINTNYTIRKIDPTFTSALVYIDELNATVALDKKDLGLKELDMNKISKDQVPDQAKIKYIDIWFN